MSATLDRTPGQRTRTRRALDGIGSDFIPYTGAIKNADLGAKDLTTTSSITGGTLTDGTLSITGGDLSTTGTLNADGLIIGATAGGTITDIKDEDNLASNSQTMLATQQSIKAYVDNTLSTGYVPYTGANAHVDLGAYNLTTTGIGTFKTLQLNVTNYTDTIFKITHTDGDLIELEGEADEDVNFWTRAGRSVRHKFASDIDGTPKTGSFELDSAGNMVFRVDQASFYIDYYTNMLFRSGPIGSFVNALTLNSAGDLVAAASGTFTTLQLNPTGYGADVVDFINVTVDDGDILELTAAANENVALWVRAGRSVASRFQSDLNEADGGPHTGSFELDSVGNMVFRCDQSGLYFDYINALFIRSGAGYTTRLTLDSAGDFNFHSGNLTTTGLITTGNLDVDTLNLNGNVISDSTGTISFDDENLITTGDITGQLQMGQNLTPTYTTVQHWSNLTQSACVLSGGTISDSGSGQIDVTAATGIIKTTASDIGANVFFNYAGELNFSLDNNVLNFIYLTYVDTENAPTLAKTTDRTTINDQTEILIGWVYRVDNDLHILNLGHRFQDHNSRNRQRVRNTRGFERYTGLVVSTDATRHVLSTEGIIYRYIDKLTIAAFDSTVGGGNTFSYWYRAAAEGEWTEVTGQTIINNANYDDGDGTLGALSANRYGVHWVYISSDSHVHILSLIHISEPTRPY